MSDEQGDVFDRALDAASDAFRKTIDDHFGRIYDGSAEDEARLVEEYRASAERLRRGAVLHLRTGLIDADFTCWHSDLADANFMEG